MTDTQFKLLKAPIIEAVLDIDCDLPPGRDIALLEPPAHDLLRAQYPSVRRVFVQTHQIQPQADKPPLLSVHQAVQALQFLSQDEKQLVQYRSQGFSFNRLAPYTSLDEYLPEIERTWKSFVVVAAPLQIRAVRLRYINRILLPMTEPQLDLEHYLKVGPRLPDEKKLTFTGFLNQYSAVEFGTGNQVNIVLTTQPPENNNILPLIFDITAECTGTAEVENWTWLSDRIQALRGLKNRVFRNTLTEKCLNLFQQP
jgi:uncharacterized protein (TIGR04255 family)